MDWAAVENNHKAGSIYHGWLFKGANWVKEAPKQTKNTIQKKKKNVTSKKLFGNTFLLNYYSLFLWAGVAAHTFS